jgi:hypothetical protein
MAIAGLVPANPLMDAPLHPINRVDSCAVAFSDGKPDSTFLKML